MFHKFFFFKKIRHVRISQILTKSGVPQVVRITPNEKP